MRHSVILLLATFGVVASARPADSQGQPDPLLDCRSYRLENTGPRTGDARAGRIAGAVEFQCDDTTIFAEELAWDETTLRASGDVLLVQEGLRVYAERVELDRRTRLGVFYRAAGTARLTDRPIEKSMFGTMEPEIMFHGARIEKTGPRTYRLTDGAFSTCVQANPRWEMAGSSATVTLDEHVVLRNAVLRVKGVPVIYVPVLYYPLGESDRSTGFLIPTYSTSTIRGHGISNAFFWAISRSQDATFYHDWFSMSGQGVGGEYRVVPRPGSRSDVQFYAINERARLAPDGTVERPAHRTYDLRASTNQMIGRAFRLIARANYFNDVSTIQLYQQNVFDLSRRDRYVGATLTGGNRFYRLSVLAERRDIYSDPRAVARRGRLPQVNLWFSERSLGRTRIYVGGNAEVTAIQNRADVSRPDTDQSVWRVDASPTIRAPLSRLSFLSATASGSWRVTRWTDSLDPLTGLPVPVPITRSLFEARADVIGPVFARVFQTPDNGYAERFRHVIEPRVSLSWLSPFERFDQVVRNDGVDTLVGGNTTLTYSLFNRLLARVRMAGGASRVREILWVSVGQSYYTDARAGAYDTEYQARSTSTFSPVQITASASPADAVTARFQMFLDPRMLAAQSYSASATASAARAELTAGWSKRQHLPGVPGFDNPAVASHFVNATASWRTSDGRWGGTYGVNVDLRQRSLLQQRVVAFLNAQCCGVTVDYQTMSVAHLGLSIAQDRRFSVSFTLAGIGSFSNPLGSFGR